jgi:hypothetical protein
MHITIGKNKTAAEQAVFSIKVVLTKKISFGFSVCRPIDVVEFAKSFKKISKKEQDKKLKRDLEKQRIQTVVEGDILRRTGLDPRSVCVVVKGNGKGHSVDILTATGNFWLPKKMSFEELVEKSRSIASTIKKRLKKK